MIVKSSCHLGPKQATLPYEIEHDRGDVFKITKPRAPTEDRPEPGRAYLVYYACGCVHESSRRQLREEGLL